MATTLSFNITTTGLNVTKTVTIADADAPRILAYLKTTDVGFVTQGDGTVRVATNNELMTAFGKKILSQLLLDTAAYERQKAAATAQTTVVDIAQS